MTVVGKVFAVISILILIFLFVSLIHHIFKLKYEKKKYPPLGKLVKLNGNNIHVYAEGKGNITLVFMSGGGTCSPTLDFKSLYTILSKNYRVAVVEKAGYGWSDTANISRDIDTILEETRSSLILAGEKAPYVLFPHSMSGIEAIYWAKKYPHEINAIVGLDPAIPEAYDKFPIPSRLAILIISFIARMGITRLFPTICNNTSAIQGGNLSEHDTSMYRAIFYRSTQTSNMNEEIKQIKSNANYVKEQGVPVNTPMYFFISNGKEIPLDNWNGLLKEYIDGVVKGKYMELNCGHYVQDFEADVIATESLAFIDTVVNQ